APPRPGRWWRCSRPAPVEAPPVVAVEAFDVVPSNDEVVALARRDVGADISRNFRDDVRFRVASFDHAVDQTVGPEIFDPSDAERKRDVVAYGLDLHRQERLWPQAEIDRAILD